MVNAKAWKGSGRGFAMGSIVDFLGNPVFGVFILLLFVVIVARSAILSLMTSVYGLGKHAERTLVRVGLLFAIVAVILAAAGLLYWASPSVRSDYAFLGSGAAAEDPATASRSALCFRRIACYDAYVARLRCAETDDFAGCMKERLDDVGPGTDEACGDVKKLFNERKASNAECLLRNTASVLMDAVGGFAWAGAR